MPIWNRARPFQHWMKFRAEAFQDRLTFAADLAQARNRIGGGQAGLARAISREAGEPIGQSGVSKWLGSKGNRPSLEYIAALAALAGIDPGWLAMGELSAAPAPESYLRLPEGRADVPGLTGTFPPANTPRRRIKTPTRKARRASGE
jgi:transcriptional regulator with XRE-family HTH domain